MTDTNHNDEREALESLANRLAVYRGVTLGAFSFTQKGEWVATDDLTISPPGYDGGFKLNPIVKGLIDAYLDAQPPAADMPLLADFTALVEGATVHISDLTTGAVKEQWSLGNGGTIITMGNQVITYRKAGTYTIKLIAWDAAGKSSKCTVIVTTTEDAIPTPAPPPAGSPPAGNGSTILAQFTALVDGATVHLEDDTEGAVKEQWSLGNGGTINTVGDQVVTYRKAGTYTIRLIAWDAAGNKSSMSVPVTTLVDAPVAPPPATQPPASTKAAFNGTVLRNVVTVTNFSSGAVSGVWDWGDGTTDDMSVTSHAYQTTGTFMIRLTTTAADGTSNYYEVRCGAIVPLPEVPLPESDLSGQPVILVVIFADGGGAGVVLNPGDVRPLDPANPSRGAAVYYADGKCVRLVNDYAESTGDVSGHFTLSVGGVTIFDGDLLLPHGAGTRPFWLAEPKLKANPDLSVMPKLGPGSENASWADTYDKGDNGPTGVGNILLSIGTGGEHPTLGRVTEWQADWLTNPSADNLRVVRGMADSAACIPFHVRDSKTGKMLDVRQYPKASRLGTQLGASGNPIAKFTTIWPFSLSQAQSHATNYAWACELFDDDFYREQAAMWANYICSLNQNYTYRSPLGSCVFRHNAARGFGRALTVLLNAARNAPDEFRPMFDAWVREAAADGTAAWVGQPGLGIMTQGGALSGNVTAYAHNEFAPWMQDVLTAAVGQAIQYGYAIFQPILDRFADFTFSRIEADHEFATMYTAPALRADGTPVADWAEALRVKASYDTAFAAAWAAPEGSAERAKYTGGNPGDFMGYPTSATGYPAMYQSALAVCVRYATDQVRAKAAWAIWQQWERIDYNRNPKYNEVP